MLSDSRRWIRVLPERQAGDALEGEVLGSGCLHPESRQHRYDGTHLSGGHRQIAW
jgi:hypothetical protein